MRHIFTVSIDTDLEKEIDEYQKNKGYETRSEGAIQLMRKGLMYDQNIEALNKRIKELESKQNQIHLPCSVCGKPMTISESQDDPIYKDMKTRYKAWAHSSCINSKGDKK
ncbi:MAG: ribbon-helix-helix domain-containing protein [Candidatus Micrarchaeia archaeon]